jgi:hypothetical protein
MRHPRGRRAIAARVARYGRARRPAAPRRHCPAKLPVRRPDDDQHFERRVLRARNRIRHLPQVPRWNASDTSHQDGAVARERKGIELHHRRLAGPDEADTRPRAWIGLGSVTIARRGWPNSLEMGAATKWKSIPLADWHMVYQRVISLSSPAKESVMPVSLKLHQPTADFFSAGIDWQTLRPTSMPSWGWCSSPSGRSKFIPRSPIPAGQCGRCRRQASG